MNTRLQKKIDIVEDQLHLLVSRLSKYPQSDLDRKPSEKEWSVMQVMEHLRLAEYHSFQHLVAKMEGETALKKNSLLGKVTPKLYGLLFSMPVKVKSPEMIGDKYLGGQLSFWDVTKTWKKQREDLVNYLAKLDESQLKGEVFKHPYFGKTDTFGMVEFFKQHTKRHIKQIDKLLSYYKC